jgi:hypothetical protein
MTTSSEGWCAFSWRVGESQQFEQFADLVLALSLVAHRNLSVDDVSVAAADLLGGEVSGFQEVADDALDGALGDSNHLRDLSYQYVRVAGDAEQHLGVVREESPRRGLRAR